MKITANILLLLAILASVAAMVLSIYPGAIQDLQLIVILTSIVWVPIGAVLGVVYLVTLIRSKVKLSKWPLIRLGLAVSILFSSYMLIRFYVPRRIAFMASVAEFDALVPQAPVQESGGAPLNKRVGIYVVEDYAADPRGGVYFRVYQGGDGLWRDSTSYGFVHQPNREGSPYGAESYKLRRLGGGWYWFRASEESF